MSDVFKNAMSHVTIHEKDIYDVENPVLLGPDAHLFLLHPEYIEKTAMDKMLRKLKVLYADSQKAHTTKELPPDTLTDWGWNQGHFKTHTRHETGDDRRTLLLEWDQDTRSLERLEVQHNYKGVEKSEHLYPEEVIGKIVMKLPYNKALVAYHVFCPFSQYMRVNAGTNPSCALDLLNKSYEQIYDRILEIAGLCGYSNLRG